jgi:TMEM175 potassium channel family protein
VAGRERDLERFLTFVDAVVAIAITLLVLPLADLGDLARTGEVGVLLREHVSDLLGFLLSFAVIARLWLAQHAILSSLVRQTPTVVWLLLAWALTIVFLPFPTSLATNTTDDPLAKVLYIGTMAVSSALLALLARVVARDRSLRDGDAAPEPFQAAVTAATFALALAVSLAFPATGYYPLLLLFVADPAASWLRRRTVRSP